LLPEAAEHLTQMEMVFLLIPAGHLKVIQVGKAEGQASPHPVDLPLEGVAGVAEDEAHPGVLEEAEGFGHGRLGNVRRVCGHLMVPFAQVYLTKDSAAGNHVGEVCHVG